MKGYLLNAAKGDMSIVNSLLELKDFKTFAPFVKRLRSMALDYSNVIPRPGSAAYKSFSAFAGAFQRRFRNRRCTVFDVLRALAETSLQWGFSISPLIADLEGLNKAMSTAADRIDKIYGRSGQRRLIRFKRYIPAFMYPSSEVTVRNGLYERHNNPYPEGVPGLVDESTRMTYPRAVLHGQMEMTQHAPDLARVQAALLGLLDELGANLNPSIVWNAIPYSFLIDWVAGVSDFLDQFKIENVRPVTVIHRCCYSLNVVRLTVRSVRYCVDGPWDSGWRTAAVVKEEAYRRFSDNLSWVPIGTSGLSKREVVLATSLVTVKWPKRRKR